MHRLPSASEQERLLDTIGTFADVRPSALVVLRYCFQQTMSAASNGSTPERINALQLRNYCARHGGPSSENGVYNDLNHLKSKLSDFFSTHVIGRREPFFVTIEPHSHIPRFDRNRPPCPRLEQFWEPYFSRFSPCTLYYPAPQFFRHRTGAYLRHPRANWRDQKALVSEALHLDQNDLRPTYSFTASGITAGMAAILECFHLNECDLHVEPLKATNEFLPPGDQPAIVLAAPTTSLELIESIERSLPLRTTRQGGRNRYTCRSLGGMRQRTYTDGMQEETEFEKDRLEVQKFVILTRRRERVQSPQPGADEVERTVTLVSGHSRSVQAVVESLTNESLISELTERLGYPIPSAFQALIRVKFVTRSGELMLADHEPLSILEPRPTEPWR